MNVTADSGVGTPSADSQYNAGELTITLHNFKGNGIASFEQVEESAESEGINTWKLTDDLGNEYTMSLKNGKDGNGIIAIETEEQEGDEAVNTVTIKTDANPEGVTLDVRNGSRGNGIASSSEVLSPDDGGVNTHTIIDTDGNEHVFHTVNGHEGKQGPQGDSAVYNPEDPDAPDFEMASTTGQSTTKAMTQKAVTDELEKKIEPIAGNTSHDLDIADLYGNIIASFLGGRLETKECSYVVNTDGDGVFIADEKGNIYGWMISDVFMTKSFKTRSSDDFYNMYLPDSSVVVYNTFNDIDRASYYSCIGSRNYGLSVWLDHFVYQSSKEKKAFFDKNGKTYMNFSQEAYGWADLLKREITEVFPLNENRQSLSVKNRQVLNTATSSIFPKVLVIGDSITEGWLANYPTMENTPTTYWSWAKYFFQKDKQQNGGDFDSIFIGTLNGVHIQYDGVDVDAYAEGRGAWHAKVYWDSASFNNKSNAFYDSTLKHFSLASYLNKYKTLADDGVTRLVLGSTAGSSVTNVNAYDVCTPNIVVIQLGMNNTAPNHKEYVVKMIQQIKAEYPDMKIILSCIDAALCMFPSLYPQYDDISLTDYDDAHSRTLNIMKWAIDTLPSLTYTFNNTEYEMTEANGVYVIYTGAVMPMPHSCNVREIVNPLAVTQDELRRYVGMYYVDRIKHPSRYAHAAIGYELYSAIKWILLN